MMKRPNLILASMMLSSLMGASFGCKTKPVSEVKSESSEKNSFSNDDISGLSAAQRQEMADRLKDRTGLAAGFNNNFNSLMARINKSSGEASYLKILKNYYTGELIGKFTKEEYDAFGSAWTSMKRSRDLVEKNERRMQEILLGKVDASALAKIMLPYDFRLRAVLNVLNQDLKTENKDLLVKDVGQFLNFVSDTSQAQAEAAVAYASEVLNSLYPPSAEIYEKNVAGIREAKKLANELLQNFNGVRSDIVEGLPDSMQDEASERLNSQEVVGGIKKFWNDDIETMIRYYNPGGSGMNLAEGTVGKVKNKAWNWLAALKFKTFSFNVGALGSFNDLFAQYVKRYTISSGANRGFCSNWTAKVGKSLGGGKLIGVPYGIGMQWDYEMFEKGGLLSNITHYSLIRLLTGVETGIDSGVGFDVAGKVPGLPGIVTNAYYSHTADVIGVDVQLLHFSSMGWAGFAGASAQIHQNLTCAKRSGENDPSEWARKKAQEKLNSAVSGLKDKAIASLPDWLSAEGVNKIRAE